MANNLTISSESPTALLDVVALVGGKFRLSSVTYASGPPLVFTATFSTIADMTPEEEAAQVQWLQNHAARLRGIANPPA